MFKKCKGKVKNGILRDLCDCWYYFKCGNMPNFKEIDENKDCFHSYNKMFPDSDIAKRMQKKRTKIGYLIVFGLAPYFHNELKKLMFK